MGDIATLLRWAREDRQGIDPNGAARAKQLAHLRARSPLRSTRDQADAGHLPLFSAANEPTLF